MSVRILVADHHVAAVAGVSGFMSGTEIEVVAEARSGNEAVEKAVEVGPDVVLMAVWLPGENGLGALERIKQARPEMPVLMTACHPHPAELAQAHRLGASGFLLKDFTPERLQAAILRVASGEQIWSREEVRRATGVLSSDHPTSDIEAPLTPRERDVLGYVVEGLTNQGIAEQLDISYETVKEHVQHVIRKVGVRDRTQVAVWAVRKGAV
ncbi:MAG: response regulator transcription factor [Planctomycetes bacterium]|nr:response regulator transcription factor [Planctomycetota bacterium]